LRDARPSRSSGFSKMSTRRVVLVEIICMLPLRSASHPEMPDRGAQITFGSSDIVLEQTHNGHIVLDRRS
jgi:hypothetical protein